MDDITTETYDETYDDGDTLGGRITRARDLAGLTLEDAASRIGVTDETLSEWESDRSEPRANKIMTLAGVMGVSPAWLISGAGDAPQSPGISLAVDEMTGEINRLRELALQITSCIETLEGRLVTLTRAVNE
ncbi:transcriptional regulator with XRE-family HTH domain [Hoeflea halophila]|uniref:Transcriptional regulator with XRE-family HTH domain n=1 Tax=Hoeflea halophila TaxID=714899 RepID=A0A286IH13_9HYPH|nr:helix-turn-helix transcriptional regulator [Hoeflea halophila]SOE18649.1 transcriptional regulator with XRE-family HTH domain [Hoeflea halophila]